MEIKLYKLYNTATGLFNSGGGKWTKRGKAWNELRHLKTKLTSEAKEALSVAFWNGDITKEAYYALHYAHADTPDTLRELYHRYLPDTWVVIEITNTGVRELCKACELV